MAEITGLRNNALPYPIYGCAYGLTFPLFTSAGAIKSGAASLDSERSLNGDTFADCTNEATEIATSSGHYYLLLTAAEMTADVVSVQVKSSDALTRSFTLFPRKLPILATGTCQGSNDTGDIQLASGDSAVDDYYNGCLCVAVIDGTTEARIINDYVGSTKVAEISPAWNTAQPDSNDTYTIYLPEGRQVNPSNVTHWNGTAVPTEHTAGYPIITIKDGTGTGEINTNAGAIALVDTLTTYTGNTPQTGDSFAIVNSGTHGNAAIKGYVDDIGTAGAGLTAVPWNAAWDTEVQSEVQDAIEVNHLDHFIAVADPGSVVANSSFLAKLVSKSATPAFSSYDNTTDSLEANRDNIGTAGASLTAADDAVITAIAALNNLSAAQVNAECDTALSDVGLTTTITGRIDAAVSSRMATYTQPTGFLAATFPTTVASTTNISAATGVVLAAAGLDSITITPPSSAIGSWNFRERMVMLFRRFFGKAVLNSSDATLKAYATDGSTVLSTQTTADSGGIQTQGEAS